MATGMTRRRFLQATALSAPTVTLASGTLAAARRAATQDEPGQAFQPQQRPCSCTGGQATSPHEQNTQQSPGSGFSMALQPGHW